MQLNQYVSPAKQANPISQKNPYPNIHAWVNIANHKRILKEPEYNFEQKNAISLPALKQELQSYILDQGQEPVQ